MGGIYFLMPNTIRLRFALSILIKFIKNLIKILYLVNLTFYLYENIILFILFG